MIDRWIIVKTGGYDRPEAYGSFKSEYEGICALWQELLDSGYEPEEDETPESYYLSTDDVWVVRYVTHEKGEHLG